MSDNLDLQVVPELPLNLDTTILFKKPYKKKKRNRDKTRIKLVTDDVDENSSQSRKRKRSVPSKLKASTALEYIPLKRPRGRPPLNLPSGTVSSINFSVVPRVPNRSHARKVDVAPLAVLPFTAFQPSKPSKILTESVENEGVKTQRPHSALVTHRILNRLMTEGPLSVADLVGHGVEAPPRDLVQSILDILQVMAVVVQLKLKDPKPPPVSSSSANTAANLNSSIYAMAGLAKGSEYTELSRIIEVTRLKLSNAAATKERIIKLQEIAMLGNDVSPAERIQLLRSTIEDFCIADESLEDDPLYRTVSELTAKSAQSDR